MLVTAASADDGTTAPEVLGRLTEEQSARLRTVWCDQKYRNYRLEAWLKSSEAAYRMEVVERPAGSRGFVRLHRRWVVERTFAWIGRSRRNSRDDEYREDSSEAMVMIRSIHRMLRHLEPDRDTPPAPFKYRNAYLSLTG